MGNEIFLSLAVSLLLTIATESLVAVLWGLRRKETFLVLLLCNCLTNPVVVYLHGLLGLTMVLEAAAVLVEWLCYRARAPEVKRPLLFSIVANGASFLLGLLI